MKSYPEAPLSIKALMWKKKSQEEISIAITK